ncbi:hypothetical protein [Streptomyces sp. NPDC057438]
MGAWAAVRPGLAMDLLLAGAPVLVSADAPEWGVPAGPVAGVLAAPGVRR